MEVAMYKRLAWAGQGNANGRSESVVIRPNVRKITPMMAEWRRRRQYRADLRRLLKVGPYMLADIGVGQEDALRESATPFWRP
jgi:uncharacterized protein YjiS (DUF1127 family)